MTSSKLAISFRISKLHHQFFKPILLQIMTSSGWGDWMCCYISQITKTSKFNWILWWLIALMLQIWAGWIMSAGLENLKMQVFWNITPCSWKYSSQHPRRLECWTSIHEPQTSHQKTCYMSPESNSYPQITVFKQFKIKAHVFFSLLHVDIQLFIWLML